MAALLAWLRRPRCRYRMGLSVTVTVFFVAVMAVVFLLLALMFLDNVRVNTGV